MKCFIVLATLALATATPQHFIADTPEVQAAKAQFARAFNDAAQRNNIAPSPFAPEHHMTAAYNYAPAAHPVHAVPHQQFIADTPEVQAAKAQHAAAFDAARRNTIAAHVDNYNYAPVAPTMHAAPVHTVGNFEDGQTWPEAEPYIHEEILAEPYIHMEEPYVHIEPVHVEEPAYVQAPVAPVAPVNYNFVPAAPVAQVAPAAHMFHHAAPVDQVVPANYNYAPVAHVDQVVPNTYNYAPVAPVNYNFAHQAAQVVPAVPVNHNYAPVAPLVESPVPVNFNYAQVAPVAQAAPVFQTAAPVNYNFAPVAPVEHMTPVAEGCFNFQGEPVPCRH